MQDQILSTLFENLPVGVVAMNADSEVLFYNRFEEELAGRNRRDVLGKRFFRDVAPCTQVAHLEERFLDGIRSSNLDYELDFRFPRPFAQQPRDVHLKMSTLEHRQGRIGLLLVEDVSHIRAIERTKDFLVRALAHDMSSPLMSAMGSLEHYEATATYRERMQLVDATRVSLDRLRRMLLNLHDVTKLHSSELPLDYRDCNLFTLVSETVEEKQTAARRAGVQLVAKVPAAGRDVEVDPALLRRCLDNLLDNAIAYTPEGGQVRVRLDVPDTHFLIEVADDGPGVPESMRQSILRPFERAEGRDESGTHRGLGLAFVDLVAREHGGSVHLHCPDEGGSVFSLMLPNARPSGD